MLSRLCAIMLSVVNLNVVLPDVIILSMLCHYVECCIAESHHAKYTECHYVVSCKCHYAKCHFAE